MATTDLLGTDRSRMAPPTSPISERIARWTEAISAIDAFQFNLDISSIDDNNQVRALFTNTLAIGETLVRDLPGNEEIFAIQSNLRTRYFAAYAMSEKTADQILNEVFGVES